MMSQNRLGDFQFLLGRTDQAHRGELIYHRRIWRKPGEGRREYPACPFIHALVDGPQITEISDEDFTGDGETSPLLRKYLRKFDRTITVNGRRLP
jgi:hypothetical protein